MNQHTALTGDEQPTERTGSNPPAAAFRAAQRDLLEQVGLDVRSRSVDLESPGVRTQIVEAGPPEGDGTPPLVFVHGTSAFAAFLAPLMAEVDGSRLIAFDRPGYGLAGEFVYTEGNLRRTVVDALGSVLRALGLDRVDLVGHSMGGHASVAFALAHPERVRRLALVGSVPAFPGTTPPLPFRLMTVPGLGRLLQLVQKPGEAGVLDFAEVFGERESIQRYPPLIRAIAAQQADARSARAGESEFESLISPRGFRPSVRIRGEELAAIRQPTLVVWGEDDPLGSPEAVRPGVETIPDARLEVVPGAHAPFFGHPERCAELVEEFRDA